MLTHHIRENSTRLFVEVGISTREIVTSPGGPQINIRAIWVCAVVKRMISRQFRPG